MGNGITLPFDAEDEGVARQVAWLMGESVAQRLRAAGLAARVVSAWGRDAATLQSRSRQATLPRPTQLTGEVCAVAADLLADEWDFAHGARLRGIGVRATGLVPTDAAVQLSTSSARRQRGSAGSTSTAP